MYCMCGQHSADLSNRASLRAFHMAQEELGKQKLLASSEGRDQPAKEVRQLCCLNIAVLQAPTGFARTLDSTIACTIVVSSTENPLRMQFLCQAALFKLHGLSKQRWEPVQAGTP